MCERLDVNLIFRSETSYTHQYTTIKPLLFSLEKLGCFLGCRIVKEQLNQKLKQIVKAQDIFFTLTRPLTRDPFGLIMWLRTDAKYSTLN